MPPAARAGDTSNHGGTVTGPGVVTVLIGGKPAARMGDQTAHGGIITLGCPTVIIGG